MYAIPVMMAPVMMKISPRVETIALTTTINGDGRWTKSMVQWSRLKHTDDDRANDDPLDAFDAFALTHSDELVPNGAVKLGKEAQQGGKMEQLGKDNTFYWYRLDCNCCKSQHKKSIDKCQCGLGNGDNAIRLW